MGSWIPRVPNSYNLWVVIYAGIGQLAAAYSLAVLGSVPCHLALQLLDLLTFAFGNADRRSDRLPSTPPWDLLSQASRRLIGLAENQALDFVVMLLSAAAVARPANAVDRLPPRRKHILRQACLAVERAAAGRSSDQLGQALHGLYAAMASNDMRT